MKYQREDGMVAVLYSPDFGSGWYSANLDHPELLFDSNIVVMLLEDRPMTDIQAYLDLRYGEGEIWFMPDTSLMIRWIPEGSRFRIHEYDGSEQVMLDGEHNWHFA